MSQTALADELQVKLVSITSPVYEGDTVTLVVRTELKAVCTGTDTAKRAGVKLASKGAGKDGGVGWSWQTAAGRGKPEQRPLVITCTAGEKKGELTTSFEVK
jgi:hypothetical protein